jgi:hypothetical protein
MDLLFFMSGVLVKGKPIEILQVFSSTIAYYDKSGFWFGKDRGSVIIVFVFSALANSHAQPREIN